MLKKSLFCIPALLLFFACTEEDSIINGDDPVDDPIEIAIQASSDYISMDSNNLQNAFLAASKTNGDIIGFGAVQNDSLSKIELVNWNPDDGLDISLIKRTISSSTGYSFYSLNTFVSADPITIQMIAGTDRSVDPFKVDLDLVNTNGSLEDYLMDSPSYAGSHNESSYSFSPTLYRIPGRIYSAYKNKNESFWRYWWLTDLDNTDDQDFVKEFSSLPVIDTPEVLYHPDNTHLNARVYGILDDDIYRQHYLSQYLKSDGGNESLQYLPEIDFFDQYLYKISLKQEDKDYQLSFLQNERLLSYEFPVIDFSIENAKIGPVNINCYDDYDYYALKFRFFSASQSIIVTWTFYGKSKNEISVLLPGIFDEVIQNEIQFSKDSLSLFESQLSRIDGLETYKEFIESEIFSKSVHKEKISSYQKQLRK
jgi:hypothetical protein